MTKLAGVLVRMLVKAGVIEHGPRRFGKPGFPVASAAPSTWGQSLLDTPEGKVLRELIEATVLQRQKYHREDWTLEVSRGIERRWEAAVDAWLEL